MYPTLLVNRTFLESESGKPDPKNHYGYNLKVYKFYTHNYTSE